MATKVIMPQLGESVVEGTVTEWLKQEGERVAEFEPLLEVSTDKVNTEIPSPAGGTILKILVPASETVRAGTALAWIGEPGEQIPPGEEAPPERAPAQAGEETARTRPAAAPERDLGFISPVVARLAREENVDLHAVSGTGEGGRITKKDVLAYIAERKQQPERAEAGALPWETPGEGDLFRPTELMFPQEQPPEPTGAAPGERILPLSSMRKQIAAHMLRSKEEAPHVTTVMEANMQPVVQHRQAHKADYARDGANLTYTPYFVSAAVQALRAYPIVNSSWSEAGIRVHPDINVGVAVSLGEEGLIVPVIHQAERYSLLGLAKAVNELSERARSHRLKPDDVYGGTFSITNHGIAGSLFATPIINQPQIAILGVGAIQKRVVVIEDAIAIRPMVYLSLTFDHRILDGASADGFLSKVVQVLEAWS